MPAFLRAAGATDLDFPLEDLHVHLDNSTLDKVLPLGPYLVTADEVPDPQALSIRAWVNGQLGQDASTADMIFPVAYLISYMSQHFTLEAGDVIATGTPDRVPRPEKTWLKAGDRVEIEVEGLGRLVNVMN